MQDVEVATEFIRLDQFLKFVNAASGGGDAKHLIQSGKVRVNQTLETRRGRKLRHGDRVEIGSEVYCVTSALPQGGGDRLREGNG